MKTKEQFEQLMEKQQEIALATSVDGQPNVRIVNFMYYPETQRIYFLTDSSSRKAEEFIKNPKVSVTTLTTGEEPHIRVTQGIVQKSSQSLAELTGPWIKKMPFYENILKYNGEHLTPYEIVFETAEIASMEGTKEITV